MQSASYDFIKSYDNLRAALKKNAGKEMKIPWLISGIIPEDGSIHTLGDVAVDIDTANKLTLCHAVKSRVMMGIEPSDRETVQLIFFLDKLSDDITNYKFNKAKEAAPFTLNTENTFFEAAQILAKHQSATVVDPQANYVGLITRKVFIEGVAKGALPENRISDAIAVGIIELIRQE